MFPQPDDFKTESDALYALLAQQPDGVFSHPTQFKNWTIENVIGHLYMWNRAAEQSLQGGPAFDAFIASVLKDASKTGLRPFEDKWLDGLKGRALLEDWHSHYPEVAAQFSKVDPKARVKWAGPDMSARSSITARLMETWAHGQEIYDILGVVRQDRDHIRNIAVLGINTFGWTYKNRGLAVPEQQPYLCLTAPSGEVWEWNNPAQTNRIEGSATGFCQVVTQTRNIKDTDLRVTGEVATQWMSVAQCFAGPVETPPAPGARHTARTPPVFQPVRI
ncbi:MAG: TIGR03084 family protein [Rhodobacteraceae bacterium]|nr:TIGR03084 family protein [Paracoccaceae bacterium]